MIINSGSNFKYSVKYKYSPLDYTAELVIINKDNKYSIIATADDDDKYVFEALPATTSTYAPGNYGFYVYVEQEYEGTVIERHLAEQGTITVYPDITTVSAADIRSHPKKVLDAIEAILENRATIDQQMYMIGGRQLVRTPISDLLKLRSLYKQEYEAELIGITGKNSRKIRTRFS